MNKSKIEWCDMTWNPITGCLHGCEYCYARGIARRFGSEPVIAKGADLTAIDAYPELYAPESRFDKNGNQIQDNYPYGFMPTFHRYRLDEPARMKTPQTIFVCSMADMFGEWVPDEWIQAVFEACGAAPWHRYLFLTKNPGRYNKIIQSPLDFHWNRYFGATVTDADSFTALREDILYLRANTQSKVFLSIEPLHGRVSMLGRLAVTVRNLDWVIVGAETGGRKGRIVPEREWVDDIVVTCKTCGVPIFMKNSLAGVWGEPLIQEFPWEAK